MNLEQIIMMQGKKMEILEMWLSRQNNQLVMIWDLKIEDSAIRTKFVNVSRLKMDDLSMPMEMLGFQVVDHAQNGWENCSRYEVFDFENGCVRFFCESFSMTETGEQGDKGTGTRGRFSCLLTEAPSNDQ